jgi:hypothetical protein
MHVAQAAGAIVDLHQRRWRNVLHKTEPWAAIVIGVSVTQRPFSAAEERALLGWLLPLAVLLVCVWAGITVLTAWATGRASCEPRQAPVHRHLDLPLQAPHRRAAEVMVSMWYATVIALAEGDNTEG